MYPAPSGRAVEDGCPQSSIAVVRPVQEGGRMDYWSTSVLEGGTTAMIKEPSIDTVGLPADLAAEREAFYRELPGFGMQALWTVLSDALTPVPRVKSVPYIWC